MMPVISKSLVIREQSARVVHNVRKRFPIKAAVSWAGKSTDTKREDAMRQIAGDMRAFVKAERLGWLGKAMLSNKVKWELRNLGYPDSFTDDFLLELWIRSKE